LNALDSVCTYPMSVVRCIDFGGCGGPQSPKSNNLTFEVDLV
jgi:hypothetical protein